MVPRRLYKEPGRFTASTVPQRRCQGKENGCAFRARADPVESIEANVK